MPTARKVKVLFFGLLHDLVGARYIDFETEGPFVSDILWKLERQYPQLKNSNLLIAVNEEYASVETVLNDGDEVALFTAVSGG